MNNSLNVEWKSKHKLPPSVKVERSKIPDGANFLTFMLYDADHSSPYHRCTSPHVQYMVANIPCSVQGVETLVHERTAREINLFEYLPPVIAEDDGVDHKFVFLVLTHAQIVTRRAPFQQRDSFQITKFAKDNGMTVFSSPYVMLPIKRKQCQLCYPNLKD
jgi:hypothetical protein